MPEQHSYGTSRSGVDLTDEVADEAEAGLNVSKLRRRAGRPSMGAEPAKALPVRFDPELRQAIEQRAQTKASRPGRWSDGRFASTCRSARSPSMPTGLTVPVGIDECDYLLGRRSSSAPKNKAAACKMSLARRSSLTSLRSSTNSMCSSLVVPDRDPASRSACLTQVRNDSMPTPS